MALVDRIGSSLDPGEGDSIILTTLDKLINWARGQSIWEHPMDTACCAIEFMTASFSRFDFDRLGTFPRPDPRQVDCMVVAGTITRKMEPAVKRLYEQLSEPKWVIAMGNCAISGGIFHYDSYSVVRGIDEFIPVDMYIAGCPPRPESLQDGVLRLREKIRTESISRDRRYKGKRLLPDVDSPRAGDLEAQAGEGS